MVISISADISEQINICHQIIPYIVVSLEKLRERNVWLGTESYKYLLRFYLEGIVLIIDSTLIFVLNFELKIKLISRISKKMFQYDILILFYHRILAHNKSREQSQIFCCQRTLLGLFGFLKEIFYQVFYFLFIDC